LRTIALDEAGRQREAFYNPIGNLYDCELSVEELRYLFATSRNPAFRRFRELAEVTFLRKRSEDRLSAVDAARHGSIFQGNGRAVLNLLVTETGDRITKPAFA
jgi:hypothetical protein